MTWSGFISGNQAPVPKPWLAWLWLSADRDWDCGICRYLWVMWWSREIGVPIRPSLSPRECILSSMVTVRYKAGLESALYRGVPYQTNFNSRPKLQAVPPSQWRLYAIQIEYGIPTGSPTWASTHHGSCLKVRTKITLTGWKTLNSSQNFILRIYMYICSTCTGIWKWGTLPFLDLAPIFNLDGHVISVFVSSITCKQQNTHINWKAKCFFQSFSSNNGAFSRPPNHR